MIELEIIEKLKKERECLFSQYCFTISVDLKCLSIKLEEIFKKIYGEKIIIDKFAENINEYFFIPMQNIMINIAQELNENFILEENIYSVILNNKRIDISYFVQKFQSYNKLHEKKHSLLEEAFIICLTNLLASCNLKIEKEIFNNQLIKNFIKFENENTYENLQYFYERYLNCFNNIIHESDSIKFLSSVNIDETIGNSYSKILNFSNMRLIEIIKQFISRYSFSKRELIKSNYE